MNSRAWYFRCVHFNGEATLIAQYPLAAEEAAERINERMGEYPETVRAAGSSIAVPIAGRHNTGNSEGKGHAEGEVCEP